MTDKLKDDLDKGHALATALVEHVEDMGAITYHVTIVIGKCHYKVAVIKAGEAP